MTPFKSLALQRLLLLVGASLLLTEAFVPASFGVSRPPSHVHASSVDDDVSVRTGKPTGSSFLPAETLERCASGSPIEKIKLAKDGTSAFVDVYEYARKIRAGEMTWEEVEAADLDTVSLSSTCTYVRREFGFYLLYFAVEKNPSHHYVNLTTLS